MAAAGMWTEAWAEMPAVASVEPEAPAAEQQEPRVFRSCHRTSFHPVFAFYN